MPLHLASPLELGELGASLVSSGSSSDFSSGACKLKISLLLCRACFSTLVHKHPYRDSIVALFSGHCRTLTVCCGAVRTYKQAKEKHFKEHAGMELSPKQSTLQYMYVIPPLHF